MLGSHLLSRRTWPVQVQLPTQTAPSPNAGPGRGRGGGDSCGTAAAPRGMNTNWGVPGGTWASDTRPLGTVLDPVEVAWPAAPRRGGGSPSRAWPSQDQQAELPEARPRRPGLAPAPARRRRLGQERRFAPRVPSGGPRGEGELRPGVTWNRSPHTSSPETRLCGPSGPGAHLPGLSPTAQGGPGLHGNRWPRRGSGTKTFGGASVRG